MSPEQQLPWIKCGLAKTNFIMMYFSQWYQFTKLRSKSRVELIISFEAVATFHGRQIVCDPWIYEARRSESEE